MGSLVFQNAFSGLLYWMEALHKPKRFWEKFYLLCKTTRPFSSSEERKGQTQSGEKRAVFNLARPNDSPLGDEV